MTYDAVAFLTGLYRDNQAADAPSGDEAKIIVDDLPIDWWMWWDERAAIMEYDGGLPRERAEAMALAETIQLMQKK